MEYGLRRYEATQRLLWFLLFLFCLCFAYPLSGDGQSSQDFFSSQPHSFQPELMKNLSFWTDLQGIRVEPFGKFMIYVVWVIVLFLGSRALWLIIQHVGKILIKNILADNVTKTAIRSKTGVGSLASNPERLFPAEFLLRKVSPLPLQLVFHPYQRMRMMLNHPQGSFSSEELSEKERRIVETDWQILWGSWTPFRWLLWCLPLLGMMEAVWLFYQQLQPALQGQKDIQDVLGRVFIGALPLAQAVVLTIGFSLAAGLLKRMENLYLSNVDALFYDQFLSRLPFQSSDTIILLDAMQKQFQELHRMLKRVERCVGSERDTQGGERN
jgi:hypothetical protein